MISDGYYFYTVVIGSSIWIKFKYIAVCIKLNELNIKIIYKNHEPERAYTYMYYTLYYNIQRTIKRPK